MPFSRRTLIGLLVFAKTSPHVATPELFAIHLASHMVTKYPHVKKAFVDIESLKWSRIPVQGVEHKHSFVRDGEEKRTTSVEVSAIILCGIYTATDDV